ncbi:uncharacterized protein CANTADRAFT_19183 [Suhomyces tanzawaensis NRRL Y-17324]|uniref:Anaphase-promoting complex subunit 4 n=1 Tax=Suhomyces tanzawaensis NRRL Y-17324 TaxID=984487 RepID=A0A1E4SPV7_9ASCO|nr:uncharacterized protein CANTADRAFT_19183 [Suhomyces tanzawaensis NRRL Y-17324]ODV81553.1 hypothetical protein CANTADRAFT_19183 [Suhomyces tanzawaensis NRRL Y-17324]
MSALSVISTNKFVGLSDGNILHWCPTLNLLTITMNKTSLWVYRLDGERIYSVNNKSAITAISTISDGSYFCLAGVDGLIKIYDSNNGNLIKVIEKTFDKVNLILWNYHDTRHTQANRFSNLFKVDVLRRLPKMTNDSSSQDIHELNNESTLNYLVIVDANSLSMNVNNLLTISNIEFPEANSEVICYLDNCDMFSQFYLIRESTGLKLVQLTDNLKVPSNKEHLVDVILKICKVVAIMNYVNENLKILQTEIKPFFTIYDRYLSNMTESLGASENIEPSLRISKCLYDILLTDLIPENLKDFWLNQFGERGFKRLNKLGNSVYDLTRNVTFTTLIASIERLLVIMNQLRGLSQWFKDSDNELSPGLNINVINDLISQAKSLLKLFYKAIWDSNEEQKAFNHFMTWIKREIIDKISKEDDMTSFLNQPQQVNFDHGEIINYINDSLFKSKLLDYFHLDLASNDILNLPEACKNDLSRAFELLNTKMDSAVIQSFKDLIKSSLLFKHLQYELELGESTDLTLKNIDDSCAVVCGLNKLKEEMTMIKFNTSQNNFDCQSKKIRFEGKISSFEFKNNRELVVLIHSSAFQVVVFDFIALFESDEHVTECDSIPKKGQLTQDQIQLSNPNTLAISRNDSKSYGCLLDVNKRDYVVFSL